MKCSLTISAVSAVMRSLQLLPQTFWLDEAIAYPRSSRMLLVVMPALSTPPFDVAWW